MRQAARNAVHGGVMLRRLGDRLDFTGGLGFRLAALLSVAILPIGMISLIQNFNLSQQAERSAEVALRGRTASAAAGERALLQSALGSADALGPAVLEVLHEPAACSDLMRKFTERSATYVAAAFVGKGGFSDCASDPGLLKPFNFYDSGIIGTLGQPPDTLVTSVDLGMIGARPVVVVIQPLYRESEVLGYIIVSLSQELLQSTHAIPQGIEGARIATFNHRGEILNSDAESDEQASLYLPRDTSLSSLLSRTETTFRARSNSGEVRVFAVVPVVPGLVYAIGSWSPKAVGFAGLQLSRLGAFILPITLWLVSLVVAYLAVDRLVLRHIRELRRQMRRFALGDRATPPPILQDAPTEITDVSQTFHNMARILIRDGDAMAAAVAEKTVLLKEVHHRVKNNLQLIASIINMQNRVIEDPDAKRVLRSVQDRVTALAAIYRNLYQAEHLDAVETGRLIGDIINQMANASLAPGSGMRIETQLQPLSLLPDQAVPLSLLATEAFTNALKYAGIAPGEDQPWIRVTLKTTQSGHAVLEIVNSLGPRDQQSEGSGLGSQLIEAFSAQLEGEAFSGIEDGDHVLRLSFRIDAVGNQPPDVIRNVVLTSVTHGNDRH